MIRIQVQRDEAGNVQHLSVKGHAGYAEHGEDIVCAAVSAIVQTAMIGLTDEAKLVMQEGIIMRDGLVTITLPKDLQEKGPCANAILNTAVLGLSSVQMAQPGFVHYQERRWQPCSK